MNRAEERASFYATVYEAVQLVPYGKVTSYGHIARLIQSPQNSRRVGKALKELPTINDAEEQRSPYHSDNVPWQRVVSFSGEIAPRVPMEGCARQVEKLRNEGVDVDLLRAKVNLRAYGWFPEEL